MRGRGKLHCKYCGNYQMSQPWSSLRDPSEVQLPVEAGLCYHECQSGCRLDHVGAEFDVSYTRSQVYKSGKSTTKRLPMICTFFTQVPE